MTYEMLYDIDETVHRPIDGSKVVQFFNGKSVLITGSTGFLGKLVLEKLLRSCKDIENVYLLMRPKKNKNVYERIDEILNDIVFSQLRIAQPEFRKKIKVIEGDISLPGLGIAQGDLDILQNKVNIVFHIAANVKMMDNLTSLALSNIRGTMEILGISRNCKNLLSFVYVSTAYSFCQRQHIEEKYYKPPYEPDEFLAMVESSGKDLDSKQKEIIRNWPNNYAFTKAIAEHAVKIYGEGIPACIFRPAIVCSTFKEPLRSWIDNYYGMTGVLANNMMGLLRSVYGDSEKKIAIVPGDYVVNAIIAAAHNNIVDGRNKMKIYNYAGFSDNSISNADFIHLAEHYGKNFPTFKCFWYPNAVFSKYFHIYLLKIIILQFLPAILYDAYLTITGRQARMFTIYKRLYKFNEGIGYFASREWTFQNDNVQKLWNSLSDIDRKIFNFNLSKDDFKWNEYLKTLNAGIRVYLLKDDLATIPEALRKQKRFYYYNKCLQMISVSILMWLLWYKLY